MSTAEDDATADGTLSLVPMMRVKTPPPLARPPAHPPPRRMLLATPFPAGQYRIPIGHTHVPLVFSRRGPRWPSPMMLAIPDDEAADTYDEVPTLRKLVHI